jgi:hypothetical protein
MSPTMSAKKSNFPPAARKRWSLRAQPSGSSLKRRVMCGTSSSMSRRRSIERRTCAPDVSAWGHSTGAATAARCAVDAAAPIETSFTQDCSVSSRQRRAVFAGCTLILLSRCEHARSCALAGNAEGYRPPPGHCSRAIFCEQRLLIWLRLQVAKLTERLGLTVSFPGTACLGNAASPGNQ